MKIVNRFMESGNVCFTIEDDGFAYPVTSRGLYVEDILKGLTDAGYKVIDYHGNIMSPEGVNIQDFVEEVVSLSNEEKISLYDWEESVLPEDKATTYFSRDVEISHIDMKAPKVEIRTREELISYLDRYKYSKRVGAADLDVRPLNSFVSEEALFSLEELSENPSIIRYIRIIEERRRLNSYAAYKELITFLQSEGVLGSTYTVDDIKTAYLAWGVCGIKGIVTDMRVRKGVTAHIVDIDETKGANDREVGVTESWGLASKDGRLIDLYDDVDLSEIDDYTEADIYPVSIPKYEEIMRGTSSWKYDYRVVKIFRKVPKVRTYIDYLSENGVIFKAKVDNDEIVIQSTTENKYVGSFLKIKLSNGEYKGLSVAKTESEYVKWSLAIAKAKSMIKAKTIEAPVDNTYDLCIEEGVNPIAALDYMSFRVKDDKAGYLLPTATYAGFNDLYHNINTYGSAEMYRVGPEQKYIDRFNPEGIEYDDIDSLIDIMINTRSTMMDEGTYMKVDPKSNSQEEQLNEYQVIEMPVERLEFVRDCLNGNVSLDFLSEGKDLDGRAGISELSELLLTIIKITTNNADMDVDAFINILKSIEDCDVIDVNSTIMQRINTYVGYLKDRAILNMKRATQCTNAMYITKIYREAGNAPVDELRHYAFEGINLNLEGRSRNKMAKVQDGITEAVRAAIKKLDIQQMHKVALDIEAPSLALKLMFAIFLKQVKIVERKEFKTIISIRQEMENDSIDLIVELSDELYNAAGVGEFYQIKWVTLCDWCSLEFTSTAFNLYCINASITPWMVTPRRGTKIPVYSFEVNWLPDSVIQTFPEEFRNTLQQSGGRVRKFSDNSEQFALVENGDIMSFVSNAMNYDVHNIDTVLDDNSIERMCDYNDRFRFHNREAMAHGKYLYRMRLRSDVVYANYASRYNPYPISEDEYRDMDTPKDGNKWLVNCEPGIIEGTGAKTLLLTTSTNTVESFSWDEQPFDDIIRWKQLILGFKPYTTNMLVGSTLLCVSKNGASIKRNLYTLTKEDADKLVDKGVLYQLGARDYLVRTEGFDYKVTV
jgi:hypothetical protein